MNETEKNVDNANPGDEETDSDSLPNSLTNFSQPEVVLGLVAPIGVDTKQVIHNLNECLTKLNYKCVHIKVTDLMKSITTDVDLRETPLHKRYDTYIKYANRVREILDDGDENNGNDTLAMLAVVGIRNGRLQKTGSTTTSAKNIAYILDQFKRPEEIELLRRVYGKQFFQISIHATKNSRKSILKSKIRNSQPYGPIRDFTPEAESLIRRDMSEEEEPHGQRLSDVFPMAEVIINASSKERIDIEVERFIKLLFGHNFTTPNRDEYGMYQAKSASLRSSDLSRQVGAAILTDSGEVITLGANEVPKPLGGTYFDGDFFDHRDFTEGQDFNEVEKNNIVREIIEILNDGKFIKIDIDDTPNPTPDDIMKFLLDSENGALLKDTRVMDILEFGRQIHAEMSAICDAARLGKSIKNATLYCTTFPCHMCAKLILGSGIKRVVYIEPYPKSYAEDMYSKSIALESALVTDEPHVLFEPFTGIAPFRYRDFFEKKKRKVSGGKAKEWMFKPPQPNIAIIHPRHIELERIVLQRLIKKIINAVTNGDLKEIIKIDDIKMSGTDS